MRYLGLILLLVAMRWTWGVVNHRAPVNLQTHVTIQAEMEKLITETIQNLKPTATNIKFAKLWTENISDTQVRVVFAYSFDEPDDTVGPVTKNFAGEAFLNQVVDDATQEITWSVDEVAATETEMVFKKGLIIKPSTAGEAAFIDEAEVPSDEVTNPESATEPAGKVNTLEPQDSNSTLEPATPATPDEN